MLKRPWFLWFFSLIIVVIGIYNLLVALDHGRNAQYYRDLGLSYPPLLRAVLALGWGAGFVTLGLALGQRKRWARRWLLVVLSNYGVFSVLWLIIFARSDFGRGRIAFHAGLIAVLIGGAAWVMRWRRVRSAFDSSPN